MNIQMKVFPAFKPDTPPATDVILSDGSLTLLLLDASFLVVADEYTCDGRFYPALT